MPLTSGLPSGGWGNYFTRCRVYRGIRIAGTGKHNSLSSMHTRNRQSESIRVSENRLVLKCGRDFPAKLGQLRFFLFVQFCDMLQSGNRVL